MSLKDSLPRLQLSTGWVPLEIVGEPDVVLTFNGYAPVVRVRAIKTGLHYLLYIQARSLADPLEPLRRDNGDRFDGLKFALRKSGTQRSSPYELRLLSETDPT